MPGAAFGGGPATSRRRPARLGAAVADPGGGRAGRAAAAKGVSSCDWATMTTGAPSAASSTALAPGANSPACGNSTASTPRPGSSRRSREGGRSDTLRVGAGAGPDGDAGGGRRWLLFHGHTRYLRSSNP
jgi:hypothetical protein